jgi:hypothetical protein
VNPLVAVYVVNKACQIPLGVSQVSVIIDVRGAQVGRWPWDVFLIYQNP